MKAGIIAIGALLVFFVSDGLAKSAGVSEGQIKQRIIEESIAAYPGNCPCPFNAMRNGRACGGRSAWSRKGGYSPICYSREVTDEMVKQWRAANAS